VFGRPRPLGRIEYDVPGYYGVSAPIEIAAVRIASRRRPPDFPAHERGGKPANGADATDSSEADRASGLERVFALSPAQERMTSAAVPCRARTADRWRSAAP